MKIRKKIEITVEYNISDEISDIDFTRVENFDNFCFDKSVKIIDVKEQVILKTSPEYKLCVICDKVYTGLGANAAPIKDGQCCDQCDKTVVIPTRIINIIRK
tara:strand:+ start:413 stop:718 length:306 start_codon:yes stop_codon:yes gene_type:complete